MLRPKLNEMAEYARTLWLTTYNSQRCESEAVAWMLKNRVTKYYSQDHQGHCFLEKGRATNSQSPLLYISRGFIREEYGAVNLDEEMNVTFANVLYSRAFSTACLVWNGDLADPTSGAIRCHRHDEAPEWAENIEPTALIGDRFFYAA